MGSTIALLSTAFGFLSLLGFLVVDGGDADSNTPRIIPAGYVMKVAGQQLPVFGFDRCPEKNVLRGFLTGASRTESDCIRIEPDATSIMVMVDDAKSLRAERWSIEWKEQALSLKRSDGTPLHPADNRKLETALVY